MDEVEVEWDRKIVALQSLLETRQNQLQKATEERRVLEGRLLRQQSATRSTEVEYLRHAEANLDNRRRILEMQIVRDASLAADSNDTLYEKRAAFERSLRERTSSIQQLCEKEARNMSRFRRLVETYFANGATNAASETQAEIIAKRDAVQKLEAIVISARAEFDALETRSKQLKEENGNLQRCFSQEEAQVQRQAQMLNALKRRAPAELADLKNKIEELTQERESLVRQEHAIDARIKEAIEETR